MFLAAVGSSCARIKSKKAMFCLRQSGGFARGLWISSTSVFDQLASGPHRRLVFTKCVLPSVKMSFIFIIVITLL